MRVTVVLNKNEHKAHDTLTAVVFANKRDTRRRFVNDFVNMHKVDTEEDSSRKDAEYEVDEMYHFETAKVEEFGKLF